MVTLIVRSPKYCSRSAGLRSASLPASFCSASRASSAVVMCASIRNVRYRSRGRVAHSGQHHGHPQPEENLSMDSERTQPTHETTGDSRVDEAIAGLSALDEL